MVNKREITKDDRGIMRIIPYGHHWIDEADIKEVVKVLKSGRITQGPRIKQFEDALCKYTGAKYAVVVSSGTAALHIACLTIGIKSGEEVITSPLTFVASANCILYCGGKPVFADVQEDTINVDPLEIKKKVTRKTKAIIPVHYAGHPADMGEIYKIANKYNLMVIEDACHALGAQYKLNNKWIKVGKCSHSDMTIFSFHPVKSITTGEGGAVLTNRRDLYERLLMFRNHGITKESSKLKVKSSRLIGSWYYEMQNLGFNYRLTDFQCVLGLSQLKKLDRFIKRRREIVNIYNQKLSKISEICLPVERSYVKSSWHLYYIRLKNFLKRKIAFEKLQKLGIGMQVHYIPIHLQPYYKENLGYKEGDYPTTENYYKRTITLPLYPKMKLIEVQYVVRILKDMYM